MRLTTLILSIVHLVQTLKSSDLNYEMCTCGDQSCIHWSSTPWQSECCQEVVTEQWSGQRLEDSKIVICAKIMKVGIILSIVNIPIFTICYLVDLLFRYKQEIYDEFFGTNTLFEIFIFVQKLNFDFPRKLSIFLGGEKLVKMLWFLTF